MPDGTVKIDCHWCLTEDGSRVVPETHPEARWLHWIPGDEVPQAEAERLGALQPAAVPEPPRRKPGRPLGSKNRTPRENK